MLLESSRQRRGENQGAIFAVGYRRIVPRLGDAQAIGAITYRLCRLIWKTLHERVRYEERGPSINAEAKKVRSLDSIEQPGMIRRDFRPWRISFVSNVQRSVACPYADEPATLPIEE